MTCNNVLCCNYRRSVCVRTAPGNVNMVAYGKINTRLSPVLRLASHSSSVLYVLLCRLSTGLQTVVVVYLAFPCKMVFAFGYRACSRIKIQNSKNTSSCERNLQSIKRRSFKALRISILTAMFMPSPMPPI